jgi:hypothetical protein
MNARNELIMLGGVLASFWLLNDFYIDLLHFVFDHQGTIWLLGIGWVVWRSWRGPMSRNE